MSSPVPRTRTMTCAPWCVKQFQKKLQVNSIWVWLYHQSYFSLWFYYYSIIFWHREWSEGWRCKLPVPSKGQKEERKSTDRKIVQKDRQTKKNHMKAQATRAQQHPCIFEHFPLSCILTRRRCEGCWLWAAPGRLWWRNPQCCCSSGSPGTGAHRAGLPRTPWRRTPSRTAASTSPPCPPPAEPPLHPSQREKIRGIQPVWRLHLSSRQMMGFIWGALRQPEVTTRVWN